jgi:hypothetical protein
MSVTDVFRMKVVLPGSRSSTGRRPGAPPSSNGASPSTGRTAVSSKSSSGIEGRRVSSPELEARRVELARRFAELQWDLGGIAYEMASRDHFRLDVLARQAAKLQDAEAELAGVERMLRLEDAGAAGACANCGALYARGAAFCWQCGQGLIEAGDDDGGGASG